MSEQEFPEVQTVEEVVTEAEVETDPVADILGALQAEIAEAKAATL